MPALPDPAADADPLDVAVIQARHGDLLWRSLHRMGIASADLPDVVQEVLLVVHRRLPQLEPGARLTTWLYGICLRVAANHRRRVGRRREEPLDASRAEHEPPDSRTPESLTAERRAQLELRELLGHLTVDRRAVFVMFELEGLSCAAIAESTGVPVGTVHSRLHAARKDFERALKRRAAMADRAPRGASGRFAP